MLNIYYSIFNIHLPIVNWFIGLEQKLFLLINQKLSNPFFDTVLPFFRESKNWIPLYIFVLYLGIKNYKQKVWLWILFAIVTVVISDQLSAGLIKNLVQRPRPYYEYSPVKNLMHFVKALHEKNFYINRGFSFVSSHATNHFAIASFFTNTVSYLKKYSWYFYVWASIICFTQVYIGVHYPADVLCGALLGLSIGYITTKLFYKANKLVQ